MVVVCGDGVEPWMKLVLVEGSILRIELILSPVPKRVDVWLSIGMYGKRRLW